LILINEVVSKPCHFLVGKWNNSYNTNQIFETQLTLNINRKKTKDKNELSRQL